MNKVVNSILVLLLVIYSAAAQNTESDKDKLKRTNQALIEKYQTGKFDDALKLANIALGQTMAIYGADNVETAVSYTNIGEIYRAKLKYHESAENLQIALAIYQKNPIRHLSAMTKILDSLGLVLTLDKRQVEAEPMFTQAVSNTEKIFGPETKQTLTSLKSLTDFYIYAKQYDKADEVFLKRYLIEYILVQKKVLEGSDEVSDDRSCYMSRHFTGEELKNRNKAFSERLMAQRLARFGEDTISKSVNSINGGVMNGKAIFLAKPLYPPAARQSRAGGSVLVKVLINENGNVVNAKAFCGSPLLFEVTEAAAKKSEFTPTSLKGSPVKVSGIITYNFVP